jgi:hypothetical protein
MAGVRMAIGPDGLEVLLGGKPLKHQMAKSKPGPVKIIRVTIDGVTHSGTYYVQGSTVHVRSSKGAKATQVGGSPPEAIAKMLLSELVRA